MSPWFLLGLNASLAAGLLGYLYADSLAFLFERIGSDDYSHGIFVPLICLFLVWQARHRITAVGIENSWLGLAIVSAVAAGAALSATSAASTSAPCASI